MIQRANTLRSGVRMTAPRTVKRAKTEHQTTTTTSVTARCELDTRADTICAGINCRPLTFTGQQCEVRGFSDEFEPINKQTNNKQHRKLGNVMIYLDNLTPTGVFRRHPESQLYTALQSKPREEFTSFHEWACHSGDCRLTKDRTIH